MAENQSQLSAADAEELEVESHAPYLKVWFGLAVFTAVEYFYAHIFKDFFMILILGLLFWAVIKACMVGWYFMHLKFEKPWVYIMLLPATLLAAILTLALVPDMAMQPVIEENPNADSAYVTPRPGQGSSEPQSLAKVSSLKTA